MSPAANGSDLNERQQFISGADKHENVRITKNVFVLGVAFMVHFTAFHGMANLQSSVNSDGSLGAYTLAAIYGSLRVSNIFLPVAVIRWIGCKWTIAISFLSYIPFIGAQFYPRAYTLVPAGLAVGLGGAPLWCAKCTYLTVISEAFSAIKNSSIKLEVIIVRFFGLFFIFYQLAQVWGNLLSSTVLSSSIGDTNSSLANMTNTMVMNTSKNVDQLCGAKFCPATVESSGEVGNLHRPDLFKIQLLSGIFIVLMLCATILVSLFADSLKRYEMGRKGSGSGLSGLKLLAVTLKHLIIGGTAYLGIKFLSV